MAPSTERPIGSNILRVNSTHASPLGLGIVREPNGSSSAQNGSTHGKDGQSRKPQTFIENIQLEDVSDQNWI
jgi:hypothetical protein